MGIPPFEWGKGTAIWMFFEKFIRKAAGMGSASGLPDPDTYEHAHDFCDLKYSFSYSRIRFMHGNA